MWNNLTSYFILNFISVLENNAICFRITSFYIAVEDELEYVLPFTLLLFLKLLYEHYSVVIFNVFSTIEMNLQTYCSYKYMN